MDYLMTRDEVRQFCSGRLYRCQEKLGAHPVCEDGREGCRFSVWAPGVQSVQVIGQFNNWREGEHFLQHTEAGIWSGFIGGENRRSL